jgi:hypothetical protein
MGRLMPLNQAVAAQLGFSRKRKPPVDVFSPLEGSLYVNKGIDIEASSAHSGLTVEDLIALHKAGLIKSLALPRSEGLRFDPAELDRFVRDLKPIELTSAQLEQLDPEVDVYEAHNNDDGYHPNPMGLRELLVSRETAASRALRTEFEATLQPAPKPTVVSEGVEEIDASQLMSPAERDQLWQAFLARKRAEAEDARYKRLQRGLA